ncbi:MAG: hypothetical protein P1V20_05710 [Verrucomicrobiales bacterium]|nr:hypothetical protein [Verrucomicrobiales bacterium]
MKTPLAIGTIFSISIFLTFSGDEFARLRERPAPETMIVTSSNVQSVPKAARKTSNRDSRQRTVTISNKNPEANKAIQPAQQPKPPALNLEEFNAYLTMMEIELNKLNETPR